MPPGSVSHKLTQVFRRGHVASGCLFFVQQVLILEGSCHSPDERDAVYHCVEVLVGVTVDPGFGPVLAVGLGGIWVEVLRDTSLRVLPAGPDEVRQMLGELRGLPLLLGARGGVAADLDVLAKFIAGVGELAAAVPGLQALEVNPLWVSGDRVEALDVLVIAEQDVEDGHPNDVNGAG